MSNAHRDIERRIMPSGDGHWYWEVLTDRRNILTRGVADTRAEAFAQANHAAWGRQRSGTINVTTLHEVMTDVEKVQRKLEDVNRRIANASKLEAQDHRLVAKSRELLARSRQRLSQAGA